MSASHTRRPVTHAWAGTDVAWVVVSAIVTILVTRAYLVATGFPQVGGDVFHIAHAVWGGLLLMIGLAIALALSNRWAGALAAVLGGVGAGLFVDEIGKFITQDNDYFFPLAAPVAYAVLAVFAYLAYRVGQRRRRSARAHLYAALELMQPALDGPLNQHQIDLIDEHLCRASEFDTDTQTEAIIDGLNHALDEAKQHVVATDTTWAGRQLTRLQSLEERLLPADRVRRLTRIALAALGAVGVIGGPGVCALALWHLFGPPSLQGNNSLLGDDFGPVAWTAVAVTAVLGLAAGVLAWRAVRRLGPDGDQHRSGTRSGVGSVILLLGGVNLTSAYFNQFLVLVQATAQAAVLAALVRLDHRARSSSKK